MGGGIKRLVMGGDINRCEIQSLHFPQQVEETEESRGVMLPVADDGVSGEGGVAGSGEGHHLGNREHGGQRPD